MSAVKSRGPLFLPLFFALCGMVFSGWNAWDVNSVPCFSMGCTLYQSFSFGGISLWWLGVGGFGLLFLLAATKKAELGRFFSGLGLLVDCLLLTIMLFTLPCFACLVVAVLLAFTFMSFRASDAPPDWHMKRPRRSWLLAVWMLLFLLNIGLGARDMVRPWAVMEPQENASIHIYVSPSCEACRKLVEQISPEEAARVAWYPVAEAGRDLAAIVALKESLDSHSLPFSAAFAAALEAPDLRWSDYFSFSTLFLQYRLWRNQAHVLLTGSGRMPFVEFHGAPAVLMRQAQKEGTRSSARRSQANLDSTLPIDLGIAGSCEKGTDQPCIEGE